MRKIAEKQKPAIREKQTQTQIIACLAEETGLTRKNITAVLEAMSQLVGRHMIKHGSGEIKIPHMGIKIVRKTKPATKKRTGINPATGEVIEIAAKPKRDAVKISALKALKTLVK